MDIVSGGAVPSIEVAGQKRFDLANLIHLNGKANTVANDYCTLRNGLATSGYQVPVGKQLRIFAVKATSSGAFSSECYFGYGDDDVGQNSATPPTNQVSMSGPLVTESGAGKAQEMAVNLVIPAGKYPSAFDASTGTGAIFHAWGILETV